MDYATVRVWYVDRTEDEEEGTVVAVYATPDGAQFLHREFTVGSDREMVDTPAALDVAPARLDPVTDPGTQEVYATAVVTTRSEYDAGDTVSDGPMSEI